MQYIITDIIQHSPEVREFHLVPADNAAIPPWQPGAHVTLSFTSQTGKHHENAYSLVGRPGEALRIAVRLAAHGRGGSRVLHEAFHVGHRIEVSTPQQTFTWQPGSGRNVLIAGGIGITPLISMAHALDAARKAFTLHYLAHAPADLILLDEFAHLRHGEMHTHLTAQGRPNLAALIAEYSLGDTLHACGPVGLMEAIRSMAIGLGWPEKQLHFESFGAAPVLTDQPIQLYLRQSDLRLEVAPGTSILDAMIAADAFVAYECKRGECGNCYAQVITGEPIHRDICLTAAQRARGMTTCVSWAAGPTLELDL